MKGKPRKAPREKDLTSRYMAGGMDEDRVEQAERFGERTKGAEQRKILKTAQLRADEATAGGGGGVDLEKLPVGRVVQVYSQFSDVEHEGRSYLCIVRKTLTKLAESGLVVGDQVRFSLLNIGNENAGAARAAAEGAAKNVVRREPEGAIEQILPRRTVLTRSDSFKGIEQHPIVANAEQMLIVASLRSPTVKWGLIDRMIAAARGGGLRPVVCLNKIDLALDELARAAEAAGIADGPGEPGDAAGHVAGDGDAGSRAAADEVLATGGEAGNSTPADHHEDDEADDAPPDSPSRRKRKAAGKAPARAAGADLAFAREVLAHYKSLGVDSFQTSVEHGIGLDVLRDLLRGRNTVLAGHSGVGKSSLIRAIQPQLDLRVGEVSHYTDKGRHTTTSARRYPLDFGGDVIDTPGVKHFGLWGVTRENLPEHFPDVAADTAPPWRRESYERIKASLPEDKGY